MSKIACILFFGLFAAFQLIESIAIPKWVLGALAILVVVALVAEGVPWRKAQ